MTVFNKIIELKKLPRLSKHDQLVMGLINAIDSKILKKGDILPSVNVMVEELGFARKTIVKAYTDLKERGIVESRNRLGYFILTTKTTQTIRVALVLYAFHTFQEAFYNTFRKSLGKDIHLDIFFHHNNHQVFDSIMTSIISQYGMYVVAPIVTRKEEIKSILTKIPPQKLLIVDRYSKMGNEYSYVSQRFRKPMYAALLSLESTLTKYDRFHLFFKKKSDYPKGILRAFVDFMEEKNLESSILNSYEVGSVKKGTVYFSINDSDLWKIIKDCKNQNLILGKDVGIFSHNENIIKEVISGGITTFSTDFKSMATLAAKFVRKRQLMHEIIPSKLIRRASL